LNSSKIIAHFYFRNCTVPDEKISKLLQKGGHKIGFHAEDTKTEDTFKAELSVFQKKIKKKITHFTKHGSGELKLGKNHYPLYEPEKYKKWGERNNMVYLFGNGVLNSSLSNTPVFHSDMFWIENWYRNSSFSTIENLIKEAHLYDYVALIHPSNYETHQKVRDEFKKIIRLIKEGSILIKIIN